MKLRNAASWSGGLAHYGLPVALLVAGAALTVATPNFLSVPNLINVARQISINGMLAVGVTLVLLTGGVDLSLGSVVALSGVVAASFAHPEAWPLWMPIAAGLLAGGLCGVLNGLVITQGRVAPFIATLGMMTAARGLALVVSGGKPVSNLRREFTVLGAGDEFGLPIPVILFAALAVLASLILNRFRIGRHLYAVGGNETAARASGLNVTGIKLFAYGFCGLCAGLAGTTLAARITTGQPNAGLAYELDAIAAVVIGGASLSGGIGSIGGTVMGALLMGILNNGLDLLNVSAYYQQIIKGLIIVFAVWMDRRNRD